MSTASPAAAKPRPRLALPMTVREAADGVGGLSAPSKMPWFSFSIPTASCKVGGRLRRIEGSVCYGCYAHGRGNYRFRNVQAALKRRLQLLKRSPTRWASRMSSLLIRLAGKFVPGFAGDEPHFRWHDSGDLQGEWHLRAIFQVCEATKWVQLADGTFGPIHHWLPTREYETVAGVLSGGVSPPDNLVIRLSAHMVDGPTPDKLAKKYGLAVSGVASKRTMLAGGFGGTARSCPAYEQGGKCGTCRTCWDPEVFRVDYPKH
jgi:hypothetical protein